VSRRQVIALVVALIIGGQLLLRLSTQQRSPGQAAAQPENLRMGAVTFTPCRIGTHGMMGVGSAQAYCAAFGVPEDWEAPAARHISLKVAIVRSAAARSAPDLVTLLDGGPGGAATQDYPALAGALSALRRQHDILLIDQRGTGDSNALTCPAEQPEQSQPHDISASLQQVRRCLAQVSLHAAPEHYTTTDAVRDLEAVRQGLGAPRLDLIGISYGTRVAQQYAARYPGSVRSIVLDSTVPNTLALGSEHARNLEHALSALFARCSADRGCRKSFGDSYATLYRVRDRLRAHPAMVTLRDPASFEPLQLRFTAEDLIGIVRFYAYSPLTSALLPLMLHEADQGNYAPLLSEKKLLSDDLGQEITGGAELSVVCAEDADLLTIAAQDADTLLGNDAPARIQSACTVWPKGFRPAQFHQPFRSQLPVLILAGEYDPVTPPAYGMEMLATLGHARLLLARGQGHGVIGAGCMPKLIDQFVQSLNPTALDATCLSALGDTPPFINYNGAAP